MIMSTLTKSQTERWYQQYIDSVCVSSQLELPEEDPSFFAPTRYLPAFKLRTWVPRQVGSDARRE
jgi:hypothetical protein